MSYDAESRNASFDVIPKSVSDSELLESQKRKELGSSKKENNYGSPISVHSEDCTLLQCCQNFSRKIKKGKVFVNESEIFLKKFSNETKISENDSVLGAPHKIRWHAVKRHSDESSDRITIKMQKTIDIFEETFSDESNSECFKKQDYLKSNVTNNDSSQLGETNTTPDTEKGILPIQDQNEKPHKYSIESSKPDKMNVQNHDSNALQVHPFTNQHICDQSSTEENKFSKSNTRPDEPQNMKKEINNSRSGLNSETNHNEREEGELTPDLASPELKQHSAYSGFAKQDASLIETGLKNGKETNAKHSDHKLCHKVKDYVRKLKLECRQLEKLNNTDPTATLEFIKKTESYIADVKKNLSPYLNHSRSRYKIDQKRSQTSKNDSECTKFTFSGDLKNIGNYNPSSRSKRDLQSSLKRNQNKVKNSNPEHYHRSSQKSSRKHENYVPTSNKSYESSQLEEREKKKHFEKNTVKNKNLLEKLAKDKHQPNSSMEINKKSSHHGGKDHSKAYLRAEISNLDSMRENSGKTITKRTKGCRENSSHDPTTAEIARVKTNAEKNRVRSLFKRQMNLITRHVVQQEERNKTHLYTEIDLRCPAKLYEKNEIRTKRDQFKKPNRSFDEKNISTLDDMEAFLEFLKGKNDERRISSVNQQDSTKGRSSNCVFSNQNLVSKNNQSLSSNLRCADDSKHKRTPLEKHYFKMSGSVVGEKRKLAPYNQNEDDGNTLSSLSELRKERAKLIAGLWKSVAESNAGKQNRKMLRNIGENSNSKENEIEFCEDKDKIPRKQPEEFEFHEKESVEKDMKLLEGNLISSGGKKVSNNSINEFGKNSEGKEGKILQYPDIVSDSQNEKKSLCSTSRKRDRSEDKVKTKTCESYDKEIAKYHTNSDKPLTLKEKDHEKTSYESSLSFESNEDENIEDIHALLPNGLKLKNIFILGDKNLALCDKNFRLRLIGNHIYLQTVEKFPKLKSNIKRRRHSRMKFTKAKLFHKDEKQYASNQSLKNSEFCDVQKDLQSKKISLKEMEDFLEQLRANKVVLNDDECNITLPETQTKEMKFLDRIRAQRKAKLMACVSTIPEKEAKFLKDFEMQIKGQQNDPDDSSDVERKKKLMQKIKAETETIILAHKAGTKFYQNTSQPEELKDVKKLLTILRKKVESKKNESLKTFDVSFELKKSERKECNNSRNMEFPTKVINQSASFVESQRFLNSVRAKIRAKKTLNPDK